MTIRSKLALGLFAIAIILVAPLVLALQSLAQLHATAKQLRDREFTASMMLSRMRTETDEVRRAEVALLFVHDSTSLAAILTPITRLRTMADSLSRLGLDSARLALQPPIEQMAHYAPLEFAAAAGKPAVADSISSKLFLPAVSDAERVLRNSVLSLGERTSQLVRTSAERTTQARNAAAIGLAVAVAVALIVAVILWQTISRPVRDLERGMAAVADGQLGYRLSVSPDRRDEFGRLAKSFDSMSQQLAQLDRLKAEFISVASHELKTPINVILGYLQLLDDGVYGPVSDKQREILHTLDAQTQALARLVQQLLDVSRFEAGGGKLDVRPVDLDAFLGELEETFHVLALQRGIDFRVERSGTLPSEVVWDLDRMNEVLGNLLSNAFKFTERGGSVELAADGGEDAVTLTVRDTGAGIPPEQLPRIFEKFYQADNQHSAAHGGAGLGLAIAKQIVTAHGGRISVESAVGEGTAFHIVLPLRAGSRPRRRASAPTVEIPA